MEDPEPTKVLLENSRFWVQRVMVPLLVCVGVAGNTITVMVLTRRRMRSSTNIYLSALAIADIIYLLFVFLLSFKHYSNINDRKYELYWRFYGLSHWLTDAASSTSLWLTVSFTIERYIAVCHPMKGKYFCTENRAKTVIVLVYIFCLLTTASTTFEYQLYPNDTCLQECPNNSSTTHRTTSSLSNLETRSKMPSSSDQQTLLQLLSNCTNHTPLVFIVPYNEKNGIDTNKIAKAPLLLQDVKNSESEAESNTTKQTQFADGESDSDLETGNRTCCKKLLWIYVESTSLGKNAAYKTFISWYSALVFWLFPLVLIATFNVFLIRAVYLSQRRRRAMTNAQDNVSISNENRITIMLIAVIGLILICQTPTAVFLLYDNISPPDEDERTYNIKLSLGNIFNLLIAVNASCNFLLYSIMSKKFRSTFRQIFFEFNKKRLDTIALSSTKSKNSQKFNPLVHGIRRNASEYHTPRNLETLSLTSAPRSKSLISRPLGRARSSDLVV